MEFEWLISRRKEVVEIFKNVKKSLKIEIYHKNDILTQHKI